MNKVQVSHLFVAHLWIKSNHLRMIEHFNEPKCMADRWKEDISTWLIWLWFDCKLNVITLIDHILTKDVKAFCITLKGHIGILGAFRFSAFASSPADINLCTQINSQIDIAHRFANCKATDIAIVTCQRSIFKNWMAKEVCCCHRNFHSGLSKGFLKAINMSLTS